MQLWEGKGHYVFKWDPPFDDVPEFFFAKIYGRSGGTETDPSLSYSAYQYLWAQIGPTAKSNPILNDLSTGFFTGPVYAGTVGPNQPFMEYPPSSPSPPSVANNVGNPVPQYPMVGMAYETSNRPIPVGSVIMLKKFSGKKQNVSALIVTTQKSTASLHMIVTVTLSGQDSTLTANGVWFPIIDGTKFAVGDGIASNASASDVQTYLNTNGAFFTPAATFSVSGSSSAGMGDHVYGRLLVA